MRSGIRPTPKALGAYMIRAETTAAVADRETLIR